MLNIITGRTGSGKTRYIRNLAAEIAKQAAAAEAEVLEIVTERIA